MGSAQPVPVLQRLQASLISDFPAYVSWPGRQRNRLSVGLIGPNPLGKAGRQYLQSHGYAGVQFVLQKLDPPYDKLDQYDMLYIEGVDSKVAKQVLKSVSKKPELTIGKESGFLEMGGIVNFTVRPNGVVTFKVSKANGKKAGLKIDDGLVTLGEIYGQLQ